MDSKHDEDRTLRGVITLQFKIPPKYPNARVQRVVDAHNNMLREAARFLRWPKQFFATSLNLPDATVIAGSVKHKDDAVLLVSRWAACKAADALEVEVCAAFHDHFTFLLQNDITQYVQETLKPHMVPATTRAVPAIHLGRAIGPSGNNIASVSRGASLIWSPIEPTKGSYIIYIPALSATCEVKRRANALIEGVYA